jgi:hypothetical protein
MKKNIKHALFVVCIATIAYFLYKKFEAPTAAKEMAEKTAGNS